MLPSLRMDTNGGRSLSQPRCSEQNDEDQANTSTGSGCLSESREDHFPKEEYLGPMRDDIFDALNYEPTPIDVLSASNAFFTTEVSPTRGCRLNAHPFDHHAVQYDQQTTTGQRSSPNRSELDALNNYHHHNQQQQNLADQLAVMCRLCLSTRRDLQPIFDTENCIPDMIIALAGGIQLCAGDALPAHVCMTCVLQLSRSLSFKQQLETADVKLRQYVLDGGYLRGMKLPASLDGDDAAAGLEPDELPVCDDSETLPTQLVADESEAVTEADVNTAAIQFPETALLIVNDVLVEHAFVDVHAGDDDDFVRLADPASGPATIDAIQHLELLDPNAPLQLQPLDAAEYQSVLPSGHELICADAGNDSESLLQPMDDQPSAMVRRLQIIAVGEETDEEDDENDDDDHDDHDDNNDNEAVEYNALDEKLQIEANNDHQPNESANQSPCQTATGGDSEIVITSAPTAWQCFVCRKIYADATRLRRHLSNAHATSERLHSCTVCRKSFNTPTELQRHQMRHVHQATAARPKARHQCDDCPQSFNLAADLRVHQSLHGAKQRNFQCISCPKRCDSMIQLKRHIRIHFEDKPHKCDVCGLGFPERCSLTRHLRRHTDEVREKRHQCTDCGKRYFAMHALIVHRRLHTGERPWACTVCDKSFIDSRLLNSHMKMHAEQKHECDVCQRRFTHRSTLKTHVRTHTGDRPYVCTECGKTFIQSSNMLMHMRSHSGERPYACDFCGRLFASSSTMRVHRRSHTGEKPYTCRVCDKKFARSDLTAHMRTHTGEKPFACPTCDRRFTTTSQLGQHVRTHTGERRHVCPECGKSCSSAGYMRKHMQMHERQAEKVGAAASASGPSELDKDSAAAAVAGAFDSIGLGGVDVDDALTAGILPHIEVLHELTAADAAIAMGDVATKPALMTTTVASSVAGSGIFGEAELGMSDGSFYQVIDPNILRIQQVRSVGTERNFESNKEPTL